MTENTVDKIIIITLVLDRFCAKKKRKGLARYNLVSLMICKSSSAIIACCRSKTLSLAFHPMVSLVKAYFPCRFPKTTPSSS